MSSHLVAFLFGVFAGAPLGLLLLGLCVAAKRGDACRRRLP